MSRICFLPLYRIKRPSSRYRVFQFLPALQAYGFDVSVIPAPEKRLIPRVLYLPRLLLAAKSHDILFLQKRKLPTFVLNIVRRLNKQIIFDFDDAIYLRRNVDDMLKTAVTVIVGNETLANYARRYNANVHVIPSVVDAERYSPLAQKKPDSPIVLGWIGSDPNRGDFLGMKKVLNWIGETYGDKVIFRIIAARSFRSLDIDSPLRIDWVPWSLEGSIPALQSIDIGLMPLPDTNWNRGKCGFKLIQYMAVGATAVASPVGVNSEIILDDQTGFLAHNETEWKRALSILIDDKHRRLEMARLARVRIENKYSVQAVLPDLIGVINKAVMRKRE